jgi:hypothetical protein
VRAIALLHSLYTGVMIVEESQERNLVVAKQSPEMQLLILSLCNCGIPMVFVGNPLAYAFLHTFAQDARRFARLTCGHLHPCGALCEDDQWARYLGNPNNDSLPKATRQAVEDWRIISKGVMSYRVMEVADPARCSAILLEYSGGVAGVALGLWCDAQTDALLDGHPKVSSAHIRAVYKKEGFKFMRPLAEGFTRRDPEILTFYADVPAEDYASAWGKPMKSSAEQVKLIPAADAKGTVRRPRVLERQKLSVLAARREAAEEMRAEIRRTLPPESMRARGLLDFQLAGFDKLNQGTDSAGPVSGKD